MTLTVYRLSKLRHADEMFSGSGGLYAAGRWTPRGHRVIYTSASISLAVLEFAVNYRKNGWIPASVLGRATIPDGVVTETIERHNLPARWAQPDPPTELREIGRRWLERAEALCLRVSSAIIQEEWNYMLNPRHPDFAKLGFGRIERFHFDRRLARTAMK